MRKRARDDLFLDHGAVRETSKGGKVTLDKKLKVLFLCTGNSCRSQMAEGWARHLKGDQIEPFSAGIEAHGLNPRAVKAMRSAGVDISGQESKTVDTLEQFRFDYVVTVCGHADQHCPTFQGDGAVIHRSFDDPAKARGNEEQILATFARVRDEIRAFIESLPGALHRAE